MSFRKMQAVATRAARADIQDILLYTERQWGIEQRESYWNQIADAINRLLEMPSIGRNLDDLLPGMRSARVGSHLLYYLMRDDRLMIVRVLHILQDPMAVDWESYTGDSDSP
jgi:toxin ParE1/3/4